MEQVWNYSLLISTWHTKHIEKPAGEPQLNSGDGVVPILQDFAQLGNYQIYACGSPEMVDAGRAPFMARGLPEDQYFSDKFSIACHIAPAAEASVSSEGVTYG